MQTEGQGREEWEQECSFIEDSKMLGVEELGAMLRK